MAPITDVVGTIGSLFDRFRDFQSLRASRKALRDLLALECRRNLSLLDAVDIDGPENRDGLRLIAGQLETDVFEQVLGGSDRASAHVRKELASLSPTDDRDDSVSSECVHDIVSSVYVRATSLRKLVALPVDVDGLRRIQYGRRLRNLQRDLLMILRTLRATGGGHSCPR